MFRIRLKKLTQNTNRIAIILENLDESTDVTSVLDPCNGCNGCNGHNGSVPSISFISMTAQKYCSGHIITTKPIDKVVDQRMWCTDCMLKDEITEQKDIEIKRLRKKLKDLQKKLVFGVNKEKA